MTWYSIINQTLSGLSGGMIVFCCALGLTIAFGTLKVLNLAHGAIFMAGMYFCYSVAETITSSNGFFFALIVALLVSAMLGGIMEYLLLRPTYSRIILDQFMVTFGAVFIISESIKFIWGTGYKTIAAPQFLRGAVNLFGIVYPLYPLLIIVFGILLYIAVYLFFEKTKWGVVLRGVTVDREMVGAFGINVPRVFTLTFMLACALSGLGGALMGPMSTVALGIDGSILLQSFIVIVIGGFGSITGAFLGSILFGLVNSFGILVLPKMAIGFPFFLMLIVLLVRPYGLLGKPIK